MVDDIDDFNSPINLRIRNGVFMAADNNCIPLDERQNGICACDQNRNNANGLTRNKRKQLIGYCKSFQRWMHSGPTTVWTQFQ